jgi:hypothetical protein
MNINEVNKDLLDSKKIEITLLSKLYSNNGNCIQDGFVGDSISNLDVDDSNNLEFNTFKNYNGLDIYSYGTVLDNSVLIKQIQKNGEKTHNQLFSWDVDDNSYTYVVFDNEKSLDDAYNKIKAFKVNLNNEDISLLFGKLDISFDNVAQILLNQKVNILSSMVDESYQDNIYNEASFVM